MIYFTITGPVSEYNLYRAAGYGFYDYEDSFDEDTLDETRAIRQESKRQKKLFMRVLSISISSSYILATILRPLRSYLAGEYLKESNDGETIIQITSGLPTSSSISG